MIIYWTNGGFPSLDMPLHLCSSRTAGIPCRHGAQVFRDRPEGPEHGPYHTGGGGTGPRPPIIYYIVFCAHLAARGQSPSPLLQGRAGPEGTNPACRNSPSADQKAQFEATQPYNGLHPPGVDTGSRLPRHSGPRGSQPRDTVQVAPPRFRTAATVNPSPWGPGRPCLVPEDARGPKGPEHPGAWSPMRPVPT